MKAVKHTIITNKGIMMLWKLKRQLKDKEKDLVQKQLDSWKKYLRSTQHLIKENEVIKMKKAAEEKFNELHNLVTEDFLKRIRSGEATTQDLKAACDWLKINDITGVAYEGNPLDKLANVIPQVDPSLIHRRLYGSKVKS
jgi:hypothetical protein